LIVYDPRNRGCSDAVDGARRSRGIEHDVDDLDAVRRHFGLTEIELLAHSYMGFMVVLYAIQHPSRVGRIVQVAPSEPEPGKKYPEAQGDDDGVLRDVLARLSAMQSERSSFTPEAFCQRVWGVLRPLYVADSALAHRIRWDRCDLPNERGFMQYWNETLFPSMQTSAPSAEDLATVSCPVLTIHGTRDRSAPYGGAREWASLLPNARLLTIPHVAHAPWIEAPELVFPAIEAFLADHWPERAERVGPIDPAANPGI
jgi:pimeloyl-ACP methyl ester carboxylesterase